VVVVVNGVIASSEKSISFCSSDKAICSIDKVRFDDDDDGVEEAVMERVIKGNEKAGVRPTPFFCIDCLVIRRIGSSNTFWLVIPTVLDKGRRLDEETSVVVGFAINPFTRGGSTSKSSPHNFAKPII
jgi:hypothetical protein